MLLVWNSVQTVYTCTCIHVVQSHFFISHSALAVEFICVHYIVHAVHCHIRKLSWQDNSPCMNGKYWKEARYPSFKQGATILTYPTFIFYKIIFLEMLCWGKPTWPVLLRSNTLNPFELSGNQLNVYYTIKTPFRRRTCDKKIRGKLPDCMTFKPGGSFSKLNKSHALIWMTWTLDPCNHVYQILDESW